MWPKSHLVMLLVCVALYPGKTKADSPIILQDFEQVIFDFFEQYNNNTSDDICKTSVPETIIDKESFVNSEFYQQLQLGKTFADHSKCEEKQCYTVKNGMEGKDKETEDISTTESSPSTMITTSSENEETTPVSDTSSTGSGLETTESWRETTENWQETTTESWRETTENAQETTENGITKNRWTNEQTPQNGTKTTVIVVSTIAAVATTAAATFYGVPWIKGLLQSGTYRP